MSSKLNSNGTNYHFSDSASDLEGDLDVLLGAEISYETREEVARLRDEILANHGGKNIDAPLDIAVSSAYRAVIYKLLEDIPEFIAEDVLARHRERLLEMKD